MSHTPYGYKIENGSAVIDEAAADKIKNLYKNYLSGLSLTVAAKKAGIDTYHATVKRMMGNRHYLGDDFYPAIIDEVTFDTAGAEILKRAIELGRLDRKQKVKEIIIPTRFTLMPIKEQHADPFKQAEYLYTLIESEVS